MLKILLSPLTTASSVGVAIRYIITIVSSIATILSILGWLTPEQVVELVRKVQQASAQLPELITAISGLVALLLPLYAVLTKSSSDRAAEAAKRIDSQVPASAPLVIKTPAGMPDIVVPGTGKGT